MTAFNPYHEWLGIQVAGSPSYYQLLGVKRQDSAEQVRQRATRLIKRLNRIDVGQHERERKKLIERIKRAAACLMNNEKREAYDRKLAAKRAEQRKAADRERTTRPQPAPGSTGNSEREREQPEKQASEHSDASDIRHASEKNVTDELLRLRPRRRHIAPAYKEQRRRWKAMVFSMLLGGVSVLGIGYLALTQTQIGQGLFVANTTAAAGTTNRPGGNSSSPLVRSATGGIESSTSEPPLSGTRDLQPSNPRDNGSTSEPRTTDVSLDSLPTVLSEVPIDPIARGKVLGLLKQAREYLGNREVSEAKSKVDEARPFARDFETKSMLERMATLTSYVETYWQAAEEQVASFKAGNEVVLAGQPVMIVENSQRTLVVRAAGKNLTFDRQNLPLKLAVNLADQWLRDDAPSTKVFRGAMMSVTPGYDLETARQLWREAEASGEIKLGDLMQVLDDQYESDNKE